MQENFKKFSAGFCGVAVIAGTLIISAPVANAAPFGTQTSSTSSTNIRVVPVSPTFSDTSLQYRIPAMTGVRYLVNGVETGIGTYTATASNPVINVVAEALPGYEISDTVRSSWSFTFTFAAVSVTPLSPIFSDTSLQYRIPAKTGVRYLVNGVETGIGTYTATASNPIINVVAEALPGYRIPDTVQSNWTFAFTFADIAVVPAAPTFSDTSLKYTIPATTGVKYFVNGAEKAAGTYPTAIANVSVVAQAVQGYRIPDTVRSTWNFTFTFANAIQDGDLVAADSSGALWNYGKSGSVGRKSLASSGWGNANQIVTADWNADGIEDIITKWNDGNLTVSYGTNSGTLANPAIIGTGWSSYEIAVAHWTKLGIPADKYPSVIAKDSNGNLWQYHNLNGAALDTRTLRGTGWQNLQLNLLDWDKDGSIDILAKNTAGELVLYRTDNATGNFKSEARPVVGTGWSGFETKAIAGYKGLGSYGILAKDTAGNLYYYGTENSAWANRVLVGAGWTAMKVSSS
jgi:hypothetical protein